MNGLLVKVSKHISVKQRLSFISAFVIAVIVHGFMLSNKIPNHDDVGQLYDSMIRYQSGRWFLFFPAQISSDLCLPWFNGVLGIVYLSLAAMIIIWFFQVESSICVIAISAIMVTFPTVASTFNYMQAGDSYFFGLLLACLAVCFVRNSSKCCWFAAVVCLTLSMGIYQAYLPFAAALLVIWHINELLIEDKDVKEVLLSGIKCICVIGVSVAAYLVITKLVLRYYNADISGYTAGFMIDDFSIRNILRLVSTAYKRSLGYYLINDLNIHYRYMNCLYSLMFMISALFSILLFKRYRCKTKESGVKISLLLLLHFVLPLAAGLIYCMCTQVHVLMVYGFVALILFPLILTDQIEKSNITIEGIKGNLMRLGQIVIVLTVFITSFNYALVSNKAYLSLYLTYEQSYAYANRLMTEIQLQDRYDKNDTIILVGSPNINIEYTMPWREEKDVKSMTGVSASLVTARTFDRYLRYYLGVEQEVSRITSLESLESLETDIDINTLSCYPNAGSIISEDGRVFVKFSDVQ